MTELMTIGQAAEALKVSPMTVRRLISDGSLPVVSIRTRRLIRTDDMETLIERGRRVTSAFSDGEAAASRPLAATQPAGTSRGLHEDFDSKARPEGR